MTLLRESLGKLFQLSNHFIWVEELDIAVVGQRQLDADSSILPWELRGGRRECLGSVDTTECHVVEVGDEVRFVMDGYGQGRVFPNPISPRTEAHTEAVDDRHDDDDDLRSTSLNDVLGYS